ncbi:MAG: hypothetical protein JO253_04780 [Alphaproteobacteria bacterium]|nr:hypothetical protein [Alphaproteobacteria bacterium]
MLTSIPIIKKRLANGGMLLLRPGDRDWRFLSGLGWPPADNVVPAPIVALLAAQGVISMELKVSGKAQLA